MKTAESLREGLRQLPIRPVYLISTADQERSNIITIGMFAFFSGNPSLVGIGVKPSRYSYDLIRNSGEYVVNVVNERLMSAVRTCGENSGRDFDKFKKAQLTPVKGDKVSAPYIKESPMSIECKVVQTMETGDHVWFIGEVQTVHKDEAYDWTQGLLFKWIKDQGFYFKVGERMGAY
ncbi:MAG: flavin reductase family protein [Candidatus Bathyarchaeota archaeon]|nr:MAG: flavin reductase family protein [Candidatus Bathyarchaeota archaeon]